MREYTRKIKEIAFQLLEENKVEGIIGFRQGSLPMMNEPYLATTRNQVENLVWDSHCSQNLSTYLVDRKEKLGVIVKGCDSRNIVNHIVEGKINRAQLVMIGVPCAGMVDRRLLAQRYEGEIRSVEESNGKLMVSGGNGMREFTKAEVLQSNCKTCTHHNPIDHDILVGEEIQEETAADDFSDIKELEALSVLDKRAYFEEMFSSCIRCYACRNACPLCYCPTCFVDESQPQWVGKSDNPTDILTFHLLRAFHCAGRCSECGACEQACPQDIKMRTLTRKLNKDCLELFGWEPGLIPGKRPPLDTFNLNDPNDFIR